MNWLTVVGDYYVMGQLGLLAPLLPYSAWILLLLGTVPLGLGPWYVSRLWTEVVALHRAVRVALIVVLVFEAIPAFSVALGIGLWFGASYGSRLGEVLLSLGGLLPGRIEKLGYRVGGVLGGLWGFSGSFVTMEIFGAVVGGTIAYLGARVASSLKFPPMLP